RSVVVGVRGTRTTRPTPRQLMARVQRFVERAHTVRFDARLQFEQGSRTQNGHTFVERATVKGEARLPDSYHLTVETEDDVTELVTVGAKHYERMATSVPELA